MYFSGFLILKFPWYRKCSGIPPSNIRLENRPLNYDDGTSGMSIECANSYNELRSRVLVQILPALTDELPHCYRRVTRDQVLVKIATTSVLNFSIA